MVNTSLLFNSVLLIAVAPKIRFIHSYQTAEFNKQICRYKERFMKTVWRATFHDDTAKQIISFPFPSFHKQRCYSLSRFSSFTVRNAQWLDTMNGSRSQEVTVSVKNTRFRIKKKTIHSLTNLRKENCYTGEGKTAARPKLDKRHIQFRFENVTPNIHSAIHKLYDWFF
jgi:hypothetical protein